jgi:[acyl-carrier-protein] S-malonyltransferase
MKKTALLFAGQGAQVVGMGRDLAEQFPTARALFDQANQTLGIDLSTVCFEGPEAELTKTENAQPAIHLVGWAAFQVLKEQVPGFEFHATAGLSLGEFTALAAGGVMSFEDSLQVVRQRGRFMQEACEQTLGSMAALIGVEESVAREICSESGVQVANLNCPGQIVISGAAEKIGAACDLAKTKGAKRALPLSVAGAYHSQLMQSAQPRLRTALEAVSLKPADMPVLSNVTALPHGSPGEILERLVEQVTGSVRWEDSMRYLIGQGFEQFIELGPGTALSGFLKRIDKTVNVLNVADIPSLQATVAALS